MTGWWRHRSIRVRLTLWYAAALSAVLALYAGGVYQSVRRTRMLRWRHQPEIGRAHV